MVDPRVLHQITVEMCTGFLLLAGLSVAAKAAADVWTRGLGGRVRRLDPWAAIVARFAEPASLVALLAGVVGAFLSMYTGSRAWPEADLVASPAVHNKLLLVGLSQTLFLSALVMRLRFRARIWEAPSTGASYALLVLLGDAFMVLQNSVGGHLAGTGSLLDDVLGSAGIDPESLWVLPTWAALSALVAFPLATVLVARRLRTSAREAARHELRRLARDVRDLLGHARDANLQIGTTRRRVVRADKAARRGHCVRAARAMGRAKRDLMHALSFTETADGSWVWEGTVASGDAPSPSEPAPIASEVTGPPERGLPSVRATQASAARLPSPPASGKLAAAVDLVERSRGIVGPDPILVVQRELQWARVVLLDLKVLGRDLTRPIGILKAARIHVRNEEWEDALRCLRDFRREIGFVDA